MSGCKKIESINTVLNKLINELKVIKATMEDGSIIEKFIEDYDKINIYDFKIDMINSNYAVNLIIKKSFIIFY